MENHVSYDVAQSSDVDIPGMRWNMSCQILLMIRVLGEMDSLRMKGVFYSATLEDVDIRGNSSFLEDWFDKAFFEGIFCIFICLVEAYFIDRGNVQDFWKSDGQ